MSDFFVEPGDKGTIKPGTALASITNPGSLIKHRPELSERFDALAEMRAMDDGSLFRGSEWKRVASIVGPVLDVAKILEPDFLANKKKFYAWLDSPQGQAYATYDRRKARRSDMVTFVDGKEVG